MSEFVMGQEVAPQAAEVPLAGTEQPPQPQPDMAPVEGDPTPEQQQAQEEYFLQASTGTVYKTREAAIAGIEEKDRLIREFMAGRSQQQEATQAAPVDPAAKANAEISALAREIEQELAADPEFANEAPEAIKIEARLQARAIYKSLQKTQAVTEANQRQSEYLQFVESNPEFTTHKEVADKLYDQAEASGFPFRNPQEHLAALRSTLIDMGIPVTPRGGQPQGGYQGVNGAAAQAQAQGRIFQSGGQGTTPAPQPTLPPEVAASAAHARAQGWPEDKIQKYIIGAGQQLDFNRMRTS